MSRGLWPILVVVLAAVDLRTYAYTALPRWGQATAIINDVLFVQGGMTDEYNAYSYTTAPINDDLLYLSLSSSFDSSSPPWQLISSSSNSSTSAGPPVAWHTISAINTSEILSFGGLPAINSPTVLTVQPDSAWLLNVYNRLVPSWTQEPSSWENEPIRRMRHSAVTSIDGVVFIVGGEKADGSGIAFSDHWAFDSSGLSFNQLPSMNGPPGITGHNSIILPNGTMLVFGGYDPGTSSLVNFSIIWTLDTKASSFQWSEITAVGTIPPSRRAFAAVLYNGTKIFIQGGCDADFQTTYSDGWVLDLTKNPPEWSEVTELSQVGQRRDHFAVSYGDVVIFGFGYGSSGPASAPLIIYNPSGGSSGSSGSGGSGSSGSGSSGSGSSGSDSGGSYSSSYSAPPPASISLTQTIPGPTQTIPGTSGPGATSNPTSTSGPGNDGGSPGSNDNGGDNSKTEGIAIGTAFGVLALLVVGVVAFYYVRRRRIVAAQETQFMLLNEDDPEAGVPAVRASGEKGPYSERWNVLKNLKVGGALTAVPGGVVGLASTRRTSARRDMLADEDTRDFGPWYGRRKREGTGDSSWSLMSFIKMRREGSTSSYASLGTPLREKSDPFSDGAALMRDEETGFVGAAAKGHGGSVSRPGHHERGMSYASTLSAASYPYQDQDPDDMGHGYSNSMTYRDPFEDPPPPEASASTSKRPYPRPTQPLQLQTMLPIDIPVHTLSPVTEASRGTLSQSDHTDSVSSQSHEPSLSPFHTLSHVTSRTSFSPSSLHQPHIATRPSSLLDPNIFSSSDYDSQSVRRSDSWWSRFSRSNLLDRRGSTSRPSGGLSDINFKDPNPPPRLGGLGLKAIEESQHSGSPEHESPGSNPKSRSNSIKRAFSITRTGSKSAKVYTHHGKSLSSLQTADSDAIERMAGNVDVVQRERTGSHNTRDSMGSYDSGTRVWLPEDGRGSVHGVNMSSLDLDILSPVDMRLGESLISKINSPSKSESPPVSISRPPAVSADSSDSSADSSTSRASSGRVRAPTGSAVAARVRDYERRMSVNQEQSVPSPTNTKRHEERSSPPILNRKSQHAHINYGLTARPSLYVANPDRKEFSGDSYS